MPQGSRITDRTMASSLTADMVIPVDDPTVPASYKATVGSLVALAAVDPAQVQAMVDHLAAIDSAATTTTLTDSGIKADTAAIVAKLGGILSVTIVNSTPVAVVGSVSLVGTPTVNANVLGAVSVTNTVQVAGAVNATLVGTPNVTATIPGTVTVVGNVGITGTPSVNLAGTPTVAIGTMPAVTIAGASLVQTQASKQASSGTLYSAMAAANLDLSATLATKPVFALVNPVGSGKRLFLQSISLGTGVTSQIVRTRYLAAATGTAATISNRGGVLDPATGVLAVGVGKAIAAPVAPASGGLAERSVFAGLGTMDGPALDGSLILLPGQSFVWTGTPTASTVGVAQVLASVAVEVVWWEAP